jgi:hypothetical protein
MALSFKARRRWALVILLVGLPAYIIVAVSIISVLERPHLAVEFLIYVALGIVWALPFRYIFRGIGQGDQQDQTGRD